MKRLFFFSLKTLNTLRADLRYIRTSISV